MSRYANVNDLRQFISPVGTLSTANDPLLQASLDRAESAINDYTRRNFAGTAGTVYVNRYGQGLVKSQALYLQQDLHTLVGLVNGDTTVIPTGSVWLEPRNVGPPYRIIRLHSQFVYVWNTDSDIVVSGTFGFSTVAPDAVVQATLITAAFLFRSKDVGFGPNDVAGFQESGENPISQGIPQQARWFLAPYRSRSGGVV
jgi:hypothetical protein